MALKEYAGAIVLEIDGREFEVESFDETVKTGRKVVKTMNRTGRPAGFARGVKEYDLKMTVIIPLGGDIDWENVEGAKLTQYPVSQGGERISYLDCFTIDFSSKYTVDGEAKRDINMGTLRRVVE